MTTETGVKTWQGYCRSDTKEEIKEAFKKKYGYEPKETHPSGGGWKVGPIDES